MEHVVANVLGRIDQVRAAEAVQCPRMDAEEMADGGITTRAHAGSPDRILQPVHIHRLVVEATCIGIVVVVRADHPVVQAAAQAVQVAAPMFHLHPKSTVIHKMQIVVVEGEHAIGTVTPAVVKLLIHLQAPHLRLVMVPVHQDSTGMAQAV